MCEHVCIHRDLYEEGRHEYCSTTPNIPIPYEQEYIMKREYRTPHSPIGNTLGKVT